MSKSVREKLIQALASGKFVSGQDIADELSVSRAAISKQVTVLQQMGLDIFKVRGKGYQLAKPLVLLDKVSISDALEQLSATNSVEVHTLIDSTNDYLLRKLPNQVEPGQACIAEFQSQGRGRRGRQWISPFGSHLYLSYYRYLADGMSSAMGLSLLTALAISDAINALYNVQVQLKWPNDVYLDGVKLAGILIDLEGQASGACHSVIGIGLNLNMPEQAANDIDQPWTDLQRHLSQSAESQIDRNQLAVAIIVALNQRLAQQESQGIETMLADWHQQDLFLNQPVRLITGDKEQQGICRGVNAQGALLFEQNGQVKPVHGGEVSLRGNNFES
ncbi:bifunctional biotin--[acetyl-CoA-carboxylase] ligase/biotin operon repressor BirA [Thalassotalea euphylliae]|uniref:Bifunctional ligase/repressor BirA n=1 Tax=Thalassotalea euphylliae TaxID=1655234 RepID=A0A3E0U2P6_9GAMM|nr:bifunctional biotin--[acetyl-CoA-carboxylase] ligase/biotin operon repressor BirA [Thalassotalea euphylliae]REL30994.1 bifunctional biotin--[acetyl-CoA-carboxylase] ligase/biotin operon repressor BirA [Thalassotalea euphylliae]